MKKIETDCNGGFVSLTVFHSSVLLFVKFDSMFGSHICLTQRSDIAILKLFLKFRSE